MENGYRIYGSLLHLDLIDGKVWIQHDGTEEEKFCQAYFDQSDGVDGRLWEAISQGAESVSIIGTAITSASTAGAGSLAGYAGIASAVSQLGLGGLMQALTGMMGTSVTGAAATAVVTSTVGGPLVMGALLVGGTSAAALGTCH